MQERLCPECGDPPGERIDEPAGNTELDMFLREQLLTSRSLISGFTMQLMLEDGYRHVRFEA